MQKVIQNILDESIQNYNLERASKLFNKSCLDAMHWWVFKEYKYHISFSSSSSNIEKDFLKFTTDYSIFKFIKSEKRLEILNNLKDAGFIQNMLTMSSNIDSYLNLTETSYFRKKYGMLIHSNHLSMLSKFATLINPEAFTMLDRNAVSSLSKILNAYSYSHTTSQLKNDYSYFKEGFDLYSDIVRNYDYYEDLTKHYKYLKNNFPDHPISELAFKNRALDKFLWNYYNDEK